MGHYRTRKRIMRDATECICIVYIIYHLSGIHQPNLFGNDYEFHLYL